MFEKIMKSLYLMLIGAGITALAAAIITKEPVWFAIMTGILGCMLITLIAITKPVQVKRAKKEKMQNKELRVIPSRIR